MGKHIFKLTEYGKLDISVKCFDEKNTLIKKSDLTYNSKPTIKEVIKKHHCNYISKIEIYSSPSNQKRIYKIIAENRYKQINN